MRLVRKAVKQLLRRVGIDIRFIPKLGFDAYADMRKLVATDRPVVFDVGANRGQTIEHFRNAFPRPVIHAFEPGRDTFAELQRGSAGIPDLHLNNITLGARAESRTFIHSEPDDMSSFLEPSVDAWGEIKDRYPVEVITVDDYCAARGIERIDILKTDTQGFDLDVIKGAQRMIDNRAIQLIFMEIASPTCTRHCRASTRSTPSSPIAGLRSCRSTTSTTSAAGRGGRTRCSSRGGKEALQKFPSS